VGVYALIIRVPTQETITVGGLGPVKFASGIYVYLGSALNSLEGRVSRHFKRTKQQHWHVDYLTAGPGVRLAGVAVRPTARKIECAMSRAIQRRALSSIQGFGCSDCECDSHLHHFGTLSKACTAVSEQGFVYSKSHLRDGT
jgi:Uri superfamily endonuclease